MEGGLIYVKFLGAAIIQCLGCLLPAPINKGSTVFKGVLILFKAIRYVECLIVPKSSETARRLHFLRNLKINLTGEEGGKTVLLRVPLEAIGTQN